MDPEDLLDGLDGFMSPFGILRRVIKFITSDDSTSKLTDEEIETAINHADYNELKTIWTNSSSSHDRRAFNKMLELADYNQLKSIWSNNNNP